MATNQETRVPRQLVVFRVGPTHYALGIEVVDEILPVLPITRLPGAPAGVLGLANVRKLVVPVFDLHWKFGGAWNPGNDDARLVLVDTDAGPAALLVDAVEEVQSVSAEQVQSVEPLGDRSKLGYLKGVVRSGEQLLLWIDHDRIVPAGILQTIRLAA